MTTPLVVHGSNPPPLIDDTRKALVYALAEQHHVRNECDATLEAFAASNDVDLEDRMHVIATRDRAVEAVEEVAAALNRIDSGTYGRCTDCDNAIAPARLEVLPATPYCVACAARRAR